VSDSLVADEIAIHAVLARYARGLDICDFEMVAGCFATDVVAEYGGQPLEGVSAVLEYVRAVERFSATTHVMTNVVIEIDGDRAIVASQAIAYLVSAGAENGTLVIRGIRYDDELARRAGGWVITRRRHRADWAASVAPHRVEVPPER
jgi:ketosteroid isomerase-like protein